MLVFQIRNSFNPIENIKSASFLFNLWWNKLFRLFIESNWITSNYLLLFNIHRLYVLNFLMSLFVIKCLHKTIIYHLISTYVIQQNLGQFTVYKLQSNLLKSVNCPKFFLYSIQRWKLIFFLTYNMILMW